MYTGDTKIMQKNPLFQVRTGNTLKLRINTGEKTLNDIPITDAVFYPLLKRIICDYPGCKIHEDENTCIWFYPLENQTANTEEYENGTQENEAFERWYQNHEELTQFDHSN